MLGLEIRELSWARVSSNCTALHVDSSRVLRSDWAPFLSYEQLARCLEMPAIASTTSPAVKRSTSSDILPLLTILKQKHSNPQSSVTFEGATMSPNVLKTYGRKLPKP